MTATKVETAEQTRYRQATESFLADVKPGDTIYYIYRGFSNTGVKKVSFVRVVNGEIWQATHAVAAITGHKVSTRDDNDYIILRDGNWPSNAIEHVAREMFGDYTKLTARNL
jgi:hypothetical protein